MYQLILLFNIDCNNGILTIDGNFAFMIMPTSEECHIQTENSPDSDTPETAIPCGLRDRVPLI